MTAFSTRAPRVGGTPNVPKARGVAGENVRFQKSVQPPTKFPRVSPARRDYAKGAAAAENPLGFAEGSKSGFGQTGLTGET